MYKPDAHEFIDETDPFHEGEYGQRKDYWDRVGKYLAEFEAELEGGAEK